MISASGAISGQVPSSQELPYITPPSPRPRSEHNPQHFSGDSTDSASEFHIRYFKTELHKPSFPPPLRLCIFDSTAHTIALTQPYTYTYGQYNFSFKMSKCNKKQILNENSWKSTELLRSLSGQMFGQIDDFIYF